VGEESDHRRLKAGEAISCGVLVRLKADVEYQDISYA
jgi:hypothetical protein